MSGARYTLAVIQYLDLVFLYIFVGIFFFIVIVMSDPAFFIDQTKLMELRSSVRLSVNSFFLSQRSLITNPFSKLRIFDILPWHFGPIHCPSKQKLLIQDD